MNPILLTKLRPPNLPHTYVVRQRLLDQLNQGARGKLNLIHAPAGYGKTTLAVAWVATQQQPASEATATTAWLTLEEFDNDPTQFLKYFIGAWQQIDPDLGADVAAALQSGQINPQQIEPYALLNQLINELTNYPTPLALVLDDWHTITNETVQRIVQYWIEHVPAHIHTLITSRELPQMPLARWRVRGQLNIIDAPALQFTTPEVGQFLCEGVKLNLSDTDITRLTAHTEGWIGALQLIALSLQGGGDLETQLTQVTGQDRYLIAYLTDEVLSQQSAEVRHFLTATAILNRFNAALCDAVTERNDSQLMLDDIEQRNLFVSALEGQGGWYRYHPLLSDTLRQQLLTKHPEQYKTYQARAFTWLRDNGFIEEAIEHGLTVQQYQEVAQLLSHQTNDFSWCNTHAISLINWQKRLPQDVVVTYSTLILAFGLATLTIKGFDELASYLERLRPLLTEYLSANQPPNLAEINNVIGVLEAEVDLFQGNTNDAITKLDVVDFTKLPNQSVRGLSYQVQGYAQRINGDVRLAIDSFERSRQHLNQPSDLAWWVYASGDLAETYMAQGDLNLAEVTCREIIASLPPEQHLINPMLDLAWRSYSALHLKRNQLSEAFDAVQRSLTITRTASRNPSILGGSLEMLARIRQAQGEWEDTLTVLAQIEALAPRRSSPLANFQVTTLRAHLHLLQGNHDAVIAWAASFAQERPAYVTRLRYHTSQLIYARWLLHRDPKAALDYLATCQTQAQSADWRENELVGAVLQASACQRLGQTEAALTHLRTAINLAQHGGYLRVFVEQAVDLAPLLRELAREGEVDPFIGAIQAAFLPVGAPAQPLIEPLTQRELEILRLIGDGLSNPQIAERLIIATGTVAYHTNNIFGKLDVRNRTEATLHARRLGLI